MTTRRVTVQEDEKGVFVKFRVFSVEHLIVRPGVPEFWGGDGSVFKKGDKVNVSYWNMNMGFFMVKKVGDSSQNCIWQGPRWVTEKFTGEWVGETVKKV